MRHVLVLAVLCVLATVARAQIAAAIGKPLPSPDLAVGTITVRVIDGAITAPHPNVVVTLTVDKTTRTATTDAAGRATFDHVAVGASVKARVKSTAEPLATSDAFVVPSDGGIRVVLSFVPMKSSQPPLTTARSTSGVPVPDGALAAGTLEVRLTYNDLADPKPPSGISVTLVGYVADDTVSVTASKTDASGVAHFPNLDHSGATAYYAMAQLPRKGGADRLLSPPIVLDAQGARVVLSAELRSVKLPVIDEVLTVGRRTPVATKKGVVRIALDGVTDPKTPVQVIDAATGKAIATAIVPDKELTLGVAARVGQVLYVEASSHDKHYRSLPFETVADRGAQVGVYILPRVVADYQLAVKAFDDMVQVTGRISLLNYAWSPYRETGDIVVPLPKGARSIDVDAGTVRNGSIGLSRAIPPGGRELTVAFEVPATAGKVDWSLDLPYGAFKSELYVEKVPGVELVPPASTTVATSQLNGRTWLGVTEISILPQHAMVMTIRVPKPPKDAAVQHACRALQPDAGNPLVGKVLPDAELAQLDGKKVRVASLRGGAVVINMMASWDSLSAEEHPKLGRLATEVSGVVVVLIASDRSASDVIGMVGAKPAFHVLLDPPAKADDNIGVVTRSWGTSLVPESFLLDRAGVVRFYFANSRDWDSPAARACVKALVAGP